MHHESPEILRCRFETARLYVPKLERCIAWLRQERRGFLALIEPASPPVEYSVGAAFLLRCPHPEECRRFLQGSARVRRHRQRKARPANRLRRGGYYAAFVVDPDGYRIEAYCDESN